MKNKTKKMTLTILLLSLLTVLINSSVYSGEIKVVTGADILEQIESVQSTVELISSFSDFATAKTGSTGTNNATNFFQVSQESKLIVPNDIQGITCSKPSNAKKLVYDFQNQLATTLVLILMESDQAAAAKIKSETNYKKFADALKTDVSTFSWRNPDYSNKYLQESGNNFDETDFEKSMLSKILLSFGDKGKAIDTEMKKIMIVIPDFQINSGKIDSSSGSFFLCSSGKKSANSQEWVLDLITLAKTMIDIVGLELVIDKNAAIGYKAMQREYKIAAEKAKKYIPFAPKDTKDFAAIATLLAKEARTKENTDAAVKAYNDAAEKEAKITTSVVQACSKDTQTTTEKTPDTLTKPMVLGPLAVVVGGGLGLAAGYGIFGDKSEKSTTESSTQTESTTESAAE